MMTHSRPAPVMQTAFVVEDLGAAIEHWAKVLGVGPFFVLRHVEYVEATYGNAPVQLDVSLAFAFSGDLQIELVQQHSEAPSVFSDFLERHGEGMQHMGAVSDDFDADLAGLLNAGARLAQRTLSATGVETVFLDLPSRSDVMLELIRGSTGVHERFAFMKQAARDWDGRSAIFG